MHQAPAAAQADAPALEDFIPFQKFVSECERLELGTEFSLRWLLRYRKQNGMLAAGAVVELRTPGTKRPRLIINRRRFAAWLANQSTGAAA
jgi:hypothetical protein